METKALYVLVSDEKDFYLEQAFVSIYSLKYHNPDMDVVLIVDDRTNRRLLNANHLVLRLVKYLVPIDLPNDMINKIRSRYLKTSCRNYVKGDFVFIDADTIIVDRLNDIDLFLAPIAAVRDLHLSLSQSAYYESIRKRIQLLTGRFEIKEYETYFNTGILYVKDVKEAYDFYDNWHLKWLKYLKKGLVRDQTSFAITNSYNQLVQEIDGVWNCQILMHGMSFLSKSKIIHYYIDGAGVNGYGYPYKLANKDIFLRIKEKGDIDDYTKKMIIEGKSSFSECAELISGSNVYIIHSKQYMLLLMFYNKCNIMYRFIEKLISYIALIFKNIGLLKYWR